MERQQRYFTPSSWNRRTMSGPMSQGVMETASHPAARAAFSRVGYASQPSNAMPVSAASRSAQGRSSQGRRV